MSKKVGVVIPVLNGEQYIADCLDSVLAQTHKDMEIVIVDDNSTDRTAAIASRYYVKYDNIKVLTNKQNLGPGKSRNRGIAALPKNVEFVAFIDHDDLWEPTKIEKQLKRFSDENVGVVHCKLQVMGTSITWGEPRSGNIFHIAIQKAPCATSAVLIRRTMLDLIGGFAENIPIGEDWVLWINLAAITNFFCVDEVLVLRRVHKDQISNDLLKTIECNDIVNHYILENYGHRLNKKDTSTMKFANLMSSGYYYRCLGRSKESVYSYLSAWKQKPYKLIALNGALLSTIQLIRG